MTTNDPPDDRFALPPLEGLFTSEPFAVPVDADDMSEGPTGDPLLPPPVDPDEVAPPVDPDDVPPPADPDDVLPPASLGIAQALEMVEHLAPSSNGTAADHEDTEGARVDLDVSEAAADDRVFAVAAGEVAESVPDFRMAEHEIPVEGAAALRGEGDVLPNELWPHFLRADAATTTIEPRAAVAAPVVMTVAAGPKKPTIARTFAEIPLLLIVAAVIAFLVKSFLAQAYYIPSGSMLPQLQIDDRVVVSKLAYKAHDPRRGDIVVFDDPRTGASTTESPDRSGASKWVRKIGEGVGVIQPSTDEFIKRVIGLPGDTVEGRSGDVFINGQRLVEPYLPIDVETSDFPKQTVEPGRLWVMGDNRSGSADSRVFGQIRISTIVGHAMVKVWPFSSISFL